MTMNRVYALCVTVGVMALAHLAGCSADRSLSLRQNISLDLGWRSVAHDADRQACAGFEAIDYDDSAWAAVDVPHNWDRYEGYRREKHGNRHGVAWYRRTFELDPCPDGSRCFLWFEGVGSYATVWVNGREVGTHAGGRTSFTLDITDAVTSDRPNVLAVRADHPAEIRDLPWVCGGCSDEVGFSEGSQPMGLFRPVHLIVTADVRIEPFGVHVWNDAAISEQQAQLHVNTEVKNYSDADRDITLVSRLLDRQGQVVAQQESRAHLQASQMHVFKDVVLEVVQPHLWSLEDPYLYQVQSQLVEKGKVVDETSTPSGIRWISWPLTRQDGSKQFLLNGKPVFINGIGEYEHLFGASHAFTDKQIRTRVRQIQAAGFNAFRDAHQPHNLRYQAYWDREGLLWWPQMAAHIWFDNPDFRRNFKTLLRDWVKERRNSPSIILWGLENESTLPTDFAQECVQIIRELDPTASSQRLITTCNGGTGTDWNVIQNWSGTYGGDLTKYAEEISTQLLNGEYGAWRSLDLHTEGPFDQGGPLSEDRMTQLLQMKVRLAESVKDQCCGQFVWLLSSHDNPGRIQNGEGLRDIDRIGPINYKGLLTPWAEPVDAFYMYRSHYVPADEEPMVYIVSHTWPGRWAEPGVKDRVTVYSNCEQVELFNDVGDASLGKQTHPGMGRPFVWDKPNIRYNVLQAVGYVDGKAVARDTIVLNHLPVAPHLAALKRDAQPLTQAEPRYHYLYRVNCGGNNFTDENGNVWKADRRQTSASTWGSRSWTDGFENLPAFYGSQRRTFDPIEGTADWKLLQTFRFGRDELRFIFPVPDGEYRVELYFVEPWYGTGDGLDCRGWRLFDVAVNDQTVIESLDLWHEAGHDRVVKKVVNVHIAGGVLSVHFPKVASGQAVISALAIATLDQTVEPAPPSPLALTVLQPDSATVESWLDLGDRVYHDKDTCFRELPSALFAADWIKTRFSDDAAISFTVRESSDVFVAIGEKMEAKPEWLADFVKTPLTLRTDDPVHGDYVLYARRVPAEQTLTLSGTFPMFSVFVVPVRSLGAPADQRPRTPIRTRVATTEGDSVRKMTVEGREFMQAMDDGPFTIRWPMTVGLASTYNLTFKFNNPAEQFFNAQMRVETSDGLLMSEQNVAFRPTKGRWRNVTVSTGTDINAGDYLVILSLEGAKDLLIQRLEVQ